VSVRGGVDVELGALVEVVTELGGEGREPGIVLAGAGGAGPHGHRPADRRSTDLPGEGLRLADLVGGEPVALVQQHEGPHGQPVYLTQQVPFRICDRGVHAQDEDGGVKAGEGAAGLSRVVCVDGSGAGGVHQVDRVALQQPAADVHGDEVRPQRVTRVPRLGHHARQVLEGERAALTGQQGQHGVFALAGRCRGHGCRDGGQWGHPGGQ